MALLLVDAGVAVVDAALAHLGGEGAAKPLALVAADIEDIGEVGGEVVQEVQRDGVGVEVGEPHALLHDAIDDAPAADLDRPALDGTAIGVGEAGVGHYLLHGVAGMGGREEHDGADAVEAEVVSGEVARIAVVDAVALTVAGGDVAIGIGKEEDRALTDDEGIADVLDPHRLAFGEGEPFDVLIELWSGRGGIVARLLEGHDSGYSRGIGRWRAEGKRTG